MSTEPPAASGRTVEARLRRAPRIGVFLVLGAVLGLIAAGVLTFTGSFEPSATLGVVYPADQVFGFLLLWTVPLGVGLGGLVAVMLDRRTRRNARVVQVDRETIEE